MNLIVAVDKNWGIGNKGELLERISADLRFFKEKTLGKSIIMGRVTFESLPNKRPLPGRKNIVLSSQKLPYEGIVSVSSIEEVLEIVKNDGAENVYVIGGEKIYTEFLPHCKTAYVTKIDNTYEADKRMVNLDNEPAWVLSEEGEIQETDKGVRFRFTTYVRK